MAEFLTAAIYFCARYFHLVSAALLVGGTFFYLLVVPGAIGELKEEHQRIIFARARWFFRSVVISSVILLLISGAVMTGRHLWSYRGEETAMLRETARYVTHPGNAGVATLETPSIFSRPTLWFALHAAVGFIALCVAVALVRGDVPPPSPLPWMRLNLILLLLAIFFACLTRNARQHLLESVRPASPMRLE